jgi:hypothetical protein
MLIPPEAYALMGAITLLGVAPFILAPTRGTLVSPRFWIVSVYLVAFVVRPLCILLNPEYAHIYIRSQVEFPLLVVGGLWMALGGLGVFWIGYFARAGARLSTLVPQLPQEISPARWRQAVLGCFLIGLACYVIFLRSMGGLKELLAVLYMRAAVYEADETAGPLKELAKLVGVAALLGMHYHIRIKRAWWSWPLLVVSSGIIGTMGGRGAVAQLWVMTYLLYALVKPRYRSWKFVGALTLGVAVFAAGALSVRRATSRGLEAAVESLHELPTTAVENALDTVPMFDQMVAAMQAAGRDIPYLEGTSYIQLIPVMVPRAIWPMETETVGVTLRKVIEPNGIGGRPSSAMGEGYLNFGLIGALVPMLFLGIWCRLMHAYIVRGENSSALAPLLYTFALFSTINFLVGVGPLAVRAFLFRLFAALVAFGWSARVGVQRDGARAPSQPSPEPAG